MPGWTKLTLLCQTPHTDFGSFNGSITILDKRHSHGVEMVVQGRVPYSGHSQLICSGIPLFIICWKTSSCLVSVQSTVTGTCVVCLCSKTLPGSPWVLMKVRRCLGRSGQRNLPRYYQFICSTLQIHRGEKSGWHLSMWRKMENTQPVYKGCCSGYVPTPDITKVLNTNI